MKQLAATVILIALICVAGNAPAQPSREELIKARHIFEDLLTRTPKDQDLYRYLGDIASSLGEPQKAKPYYETYTQMQPRDYYGFYRLGEIAWTAGDHKGARGYFEQALSVLSPKKGDLTTELARARMTALTGKHAEADALYQELLAQHPDQPDILANRLETFIDTDRLHEASVLAERSASQFPEDLALQRIWVRTLLLTGKDREAHKKASALLLKAPGDEALTALNAESLLRIGEWDRAQAIYTTLTQENPENLEYRKVLQEILREYRPQLMGGFAVLLNGVDRSYAPTLTYLHPINAHWGLEAGYTLKWNTTNVVGYNSDFWTPTNVVRLIAHYKPLKTVDLSAGISNGFNGTSYQPAPLLAAEWNDPTYGRFRFGFIYNDLFDDPIAGLYFNGKRDTLGFTYDHTFFDRIVFATSYSSVWYRVNGAKAGLGLGDTFGRNDITDTSIQFIVLKKPQIKIGYEFYYSKLHVQNDYLAIIPLIPESEQQNILYSLSYEWNKWITTDVGGFIGNDSKRNLSIANLDLYGFNISNRVKVSERLELIGHYQYSSSNTQNTLGRYQYFGIGFLYRF